LMSKNAFKCSKDLSLGTIVAKYIFFATGFFESARWVMLVEKCILSLKNTFFLLLGRKTYFL